MTEETLSENAPVAYYARCCRWWPMGNGPIGTCGYCHEKPLANFNFTKDDYEAWKAICK